MSTTAQIAPRFRCEGVIRGAYPARSQTDTHLIGCIDSLFRGFQNPPTELSRQSGEGEQRMSACRGILSGILSSIACLVLIPTAAYAQASIAGVVKDTSGAV